MLQHILISFTANIYSSFSFTNPKAPIPLLIFSSQHSRIKTSPNSTTIDEASLEEIDESLASILFNKAFHSNVIKHYYTNNLQQLNMSIVGHWEMEVQEAWYNIRESKSKSCLEILPSWQNVIGTFRWKPQEHQ